MAGERALPGLGLTGFWDLGDNTWKGGMDTNLLALSVLTQLAAKTRTAALPASPVNGDVCIVPSSDATNGNKIAVHDNGAWVYIPAKKGFRAFVEEDSKFYYFDGTEWKVETTDAAPGSGGGGTASTRVKAAAVVTISGTTPTVASGLNVASVTRTAVGRYRVTFTTPLASTNFGINASCLFGQFADNWAPVATVDRNPGYGFATTHVDLNFATANGTGTADNILYDPISFSFEIYDAAQQGGGGSSGGSSKVTPTVKGARVRPSANISISAATSTAVNWGATAIEDFDSNGFFDAAAQPTRITIPAGVTKVRLRFKSQVTNNGTNFSTTTAFEAYFRKNGTDGAFAGNDFCRSQGEEWPDLDLSSGALTVTAGDYFEVMVWGSVASRLDVGGKTWVEVEVLEGSILDQTVSGGGTGGSSVVSPVYKGGRARPAAALSVPNAVETMLTGGLTVLRDAGSFWDAAGTRIVIPAGVTKVEIRMEASWASAAAGSRYAWLNKNGTTSYSNSIAGSVVQAAGANRHEFSTGVIDVVAGDTFQFGLYQNSGAALSLGTASILEIRVVEGSILNQTVSGGSGATMVALTAAEYAALTTKDPNTYYFVKA